VLAARIKPITNTATAKGDKEDSNNENLHFNIRLSAHRQTRANPIINTSVTPYITTMPSMPP